MKRVLLLVLCVVGCFQQGIKGVYYVAVETEQYKDGVQEGVTVYLVFKGRDMEPVSFYDAECRAVVKVYGDGVVYEKEVLFDSSELVGEAGGGIVITKEEVGFTGLVDITVVVTIEGRGEFRSEKRDAKIG